jgi:hypothetical protein
MTVPELVRVLGTRAALGIGLGFLLANRFSSAERRAIGWTLLLAGGVVGATLGFEIFGRPRGFTLKFATEEDVHRAQPEFQERMSQRETLTRT